MKKGTARDKLETAKSLCTEARGFLLSTPGPHGEEQDKKPSWERYAFRLVKDKADYNLKMAISYIDDALLETYHFLEREKPSPK